MTKPRKRKPRSRKRAVAVQPRRVRKSRRLSSAEGELVERLTAELRREPPGVAERARDLFEIIMGER